MKLYKENLRRSKALLLITTATLLINTTQITYPKIGDRLREAARKTAGKLTEKLPGVIKRTTAVVKEGLSSAYQKVKGIKGEVILNKLIANVEKLGSQIGDIKDCMLFGNQCTPAKRAAFYATAITMLALTAAVVGFTITVAATSKEPEVEKAMQETSQEVKGWKPAAVFQRLSNNLASFKQNLLSMKPCLTKQLCTKQQKRMLYATAGTIMALVSIAIGIGVGSYIYAEYKKGKQPAELPTVDEEIKALAQDSLAEPETVPKSKWQAALQRAIEIKKAGAGYILEKTAEIKAALEAKSENAKAALRETVNEAKKMQLYQAAKTALARAQEIAKNFIEHMKTIDLAQSMKNILGIDVTTMGPAIANIRSASVKIMGPIDALSNVALFSQIDHIVDQITKWQNLGEELWETKGELFKQWAARAAGRSYLHPGRLLFGKRPKEAEDLAHPLAAKLDELLAEYPQLVNLMNGMDVATPGQFLSSALRESAVALKSVTDLKIGIGSKTLAFVPFEMRTAFATLESQLEQLAGLVRSTTQLAKYNGLIKAPIDAQNISSTEASVKQFILASVWNLASPSAFREKLESLPRLTEGVTKSGNSIKPEVDTLQKTLDRLLLILQGMPNLVKTRFIEKIHSGNPMQNVAYAPQILRSVLAQQLEIVKRDVDALLTSGNAIIEHIGNMLKNSASLLGNVNSLMGSGGRPYVNEDVITGFNQMSAIINNMISVVQKLGIDIQRQELPVLIPRVL